MGELVIIVFQSVKQLTIRNKGQKSYLVTPLDNYVKRKK